MGPTIVKFLTRSAHPVSIANRQLKRVAIRVANMIAMR